MRTWLEARGLPDSVIAVHPVETTRMMGEATVDARARADVIAKAAGSKVGNVRSANTGVVQVTSRYSTEVSDYGMNDVTSIEKDITAVVKVTFALQ